MAKTTNMRISPGSCRLIYHFVFDVFPLVKLELERWWQTAGEHLEPLLAAAAQASIADKGFHCQGGSIYALYPGVPTAAMVKLIVAYQTISDYLDNLVDSLGVHDERAFRQLHLAMTEALDPVVPMSSYYAYYPNQDDRGYLPALVSFCREQIRQLPSYAAVRGHLVELAGLYANLQTFKHLAGDEREERIKAWLAPEQRQYPDVSVWELAAATGSTLGIFCLLAAACQPGLTSVQANEIKTAYFPGVCGLHILLDYLIDLQEDARTEQLNFVTYYGNRTATEKGLTNFLDQALERTGYLTYADFHRTVVRGLLAMYLSDPKSNTPQLRPVVARLLAEAGLSTRVLYRLCRLLRRVGKL